MRRDKYRCGAFKIQQIERDQTPKGAPPSPAGRELRRAPRHQQVIEVFFFFSNGFCRPAAENQAGSSMSTLMEPDGRDLKRLRCESAVGLKITPPATDNPAPLPLPGHLPSLSFLNDPHNNHPFDSCCLFRLMSVGRFHLLRGREEAAFRLSQVRKARNAERRRQDSFYRLRFACVHNWKRIVFFFFMRHRAAHARGNPTTNLKRIMESFPFLALT